MKKAVCFLVSLWMGAISVSAQSSYHYDVNNDGVVNITDVILIVNHILGKPEPPEAVDLELPSGIKWASYNIGAAKPEDFGSYYAWGETEEKDEYTWNSYLHCDGSSSSCHDIGTNICNSQYDVAHAKWGGKWRLPTSEEFQELLDNCTREWTTLNGVNGRMFTSKTNGKSIFLPAAGDRWGTKEGSQGVYGYYWSGSLSTYSSGNAYRLNFNSGTEYTGDNFRYRGFTIRPVTE